MRAGKRFKMESQSRSGFDEEEEIDLKMFEFKEAGTLSGGNKRKLCVAIALIGSPQLVLLAWGMQRPAAPTAIIPKSVTPARIESNLKDVLAVALDADDLAALAALDKPGLEGCYCHPRTPWLGRSTRPATMFMPTTIVDTVILGRPVLAIWAQMGGTGCLPMLSRSIV